MHSNSRLDRFIRRSSSANRGSEPQRIQHRVRFDIRDGDYGTILVSPFQSLECFVFLAKTRSRILGYIQTGETNSRFDSSFNRASTFSASALLPVTA